MAAELAELAPRSAAKRQDILETAAELFAQRGFEKTSMKELAAEAQVSTSTIYTYFQDKTDLLDHVVQTRMTALLDKVAHSGGDDPLERIIEGTRIFHRGLAGDPLLSQILAYRSHVVGRRVRKTAIGLIDEFTHRGIAMIEAAVAAGQIECDDPLALNAVMRLSFQGWLMNSSRGGDPVTADQLTEMIVTLLRALAKATGRPALDS